MTARMTVMQPKTVMTIIKLSNVSSWCLRKKSSSSKTPILMIYDLTLMSAVDVDVSFEMRSLGKLEKPFFFFRRPFARRRFTLNACTSLGSIMQTAERIFAMIFLFREFESSQREFAQPN